MRLVIVSGLSGSGKSVALRTLEDLGFYCIDNLPLFLLKDLALGLEDAADEVFSDTAVGVDARSNPAALQNLPALIQAAQARGVECQVVFLDAHTDTLIRRFSETRRSHPLTHQERPLAEAIKLERKLLEPIRQVADIRIDTTLTNVHELRDLMRVRLAGGASPKASILLQSFGFKHGVPHDVDFLFDVRCLPNPHWEAALKPLTGRDQPVMEFLEAAPDVLAMRDDIAAYFDRWIPRFETDGRFYLTIAIGCTGGQHRSVYLVESLRGHFEAGWPQGHGPSPGAAVTVGLLLITHQPLGADLLRVATEIYGSHPPRAAALEVVNDSPQELVLAQAEHLADRLDEGDGVLVLTDVYGATPARLAIALGERHPRLRVLAGLNLPMLLRALTYAGLDLDTVAEKALAGGRDGVCRCPAQNPED